MVATWNFAHPISILSKHYWNDPRRTKTGERYHYTTAGVTVNPLSKYKTRSD